MLFIFQNRFRCSYDDNEILLYNAHEELDCIFFMMYMYNVRKGKVNNIHCYKLENKGKSICNNSYHNTACDTIHMTLCNSHKNYDCMSFYFIRQSFWLSNKAEICSFLSKRITVSWITSITFYIVQRIL